MSARCHHDRVRLRRVVANAFAWPFVILLAGCAALVVLSFKASAAFVRWSLRYYQQHKGR